MVDHKLRDPACGEATVWIARFAASVGTVRSTLLPPRFVLPSQEVERRQRLVAIAG